MYRRAGRRALVLRTTAVQEQEENTMSTNPLTTLKRYRTALHCDDGSGSHLVRRGHGIDGGHRFGDA